MKGLCSGGDSLAEMRANYDAYQQTVARRMAK